MNTNRNLHSKTVLTEFARDFDEEEDQGILSQFVNKISNIVNTNYNTLNSYPSTSNAESPSNPTAVNKDAISRTGDEQFNKEIAANKEQAEHSSSSDLSQVANIEKPDDLPLDPAIAGRTALNVLQRLSNFIAQRDNSLSSYKDTDLQKFWMPDSKSKECYDCSQKFTTFRRKHHCRLCGQIFCSKCCNQVVPGRIIKCSGDLKVCTYCSKVVLSYLKSPDITADLRSDLQALQADLSTKFSTQENRGVVNLNVDDTHLQQHRKISVGYQEERLISSPNLTYADRRSILQQSSTIKMLYEEMSKALPQHNRGSDLVNFLINSHKSADTEQATVILNALIEAAYLIPLIEETENFEVQENQKMPVFNENMSYKIANIDKDVRLNQSGNQIFDADGNVIHIRRSITADSISESGPRLSITPESKRYNEAKDFESQDPIMSSVGANQLLQSFCEHEEQLLSQLLRKTHVDESWSKILIPISARVANQVRPEKVNFDSMDIRNFVNIKKVSAGRPADSKIIAGVVFSKNVTHKEMPTNIENPRILLLQCAILYQRDEGKFVTLDNLLLQEKEYLRNVTMRILSLGPNIVLVHKSVAGIAQEMLRSKGITLVLDVKLSILERLSRCLQCDIVTSIDSNIGRPKLGTCDTFYCKTYTDETGMSKTLMFFETRFNPRGCCILLKGAPTQELAKIKKVALTMIFARYNWRHELAFLVNEYARPASPKHKLFDSPLDEQTNFDDEQITRHDAELKDKQNEPFVNKSVSGSTVEDFSDPLRADLSPSAFTTDENKDLTLSVQKSYDDRFRSALSSVILSISPNMAFPLPYLETEIGRKCELRQRFPDELFYSKLWSNTPIKENFVEIVDDQENLVALKPAHDYVTHQITEPFDSKAEQDMLASFRAKGGRYRKILSMKIIPRKPMPIVSLPPRIIEDYVYKDALDLDNHQRLPVLFYSFYSNPKATSSFCVLPSMLEMHFYGQNDIMFGSFLERYCFSSSYICPSCNLPMTDHVRRYVHSMGCVQVKLREDKRYENSNKIMMTSWCGICNEITPVVDISKDAWCLSLAKYLELRFHGHSYKKNYIEEEQESTKICKHSIHRDYVQYFAFNGLAATITYESIDIWEITLPVMLIKLKHLKEFDKQQVLDDIKSFAVKGYEVYANIHDQIAEIAQEIENTYLNNLKILLNEDQLKFKLKVEQVQTLLTEKILNTYDINDAMLMVKRTLCESINIWEPRLREAALQVKPAPSKPDVTAVDNGTICTEDLKSESVSSPDSKSIKSEEEISVATETAVNQPEVEEADANFRPKLNSVDNKTYMEHATKENNEKKTIKHFISQLLLSNTTTNILQSPIPSQEHHTLPLGLFPILVHDQDLSSIIAYSIISLDYRRGIEMLNTGSSNVDPNQSPSMRRKADSIGESESETKESKQENERPEKKKPHSHIDISFVDGGTNFSCKIYFAREFDALRLNFMSSPFNGNKVGDEKSYVANCKEAAVSEECDDIRKSFARSLCRSVEWKARGGKSGSKFSKTIDDQFVLKEMSKTDIGIFENFAPNYFEYINQCLTQNKPTLLAKIFGVYKIIVRKKENTIEKSVLVMENLFVNREISNKFDLKGSERNRLVNPTNQTGETVFLDENLIQMSWEKPLYILSHSSTILKEAINRDSSFLEKNGVMDYSLLVGLDANEKLLVLGIIDYIRTYTLDKKLESIVKQTVSSKLPTVVSPKAYKQRFVEAMERYFLFVPDRWEGLSKK